MTSSLTVADALPADIGEYFVVVSDDAGRIFGGVAQLNITNLVYLVSPVFYPRQSIPIHGAERAGTALKVQTSSDLMNWSTLTCITNVSGMDVFTDTSAPRQVSITACSCSRGIGWPLRARCANLAHIVCHSD